MRDPVKMRALYKIKRAAEVRYNETWEKAVSGDSIARERLKAVTRELSQAHNEWWNEAQHFVVWEKD